MKYEEFRKKVGKKVKSIRIDKNITQEKMNEGKFGISWRTVQDVENGSKDIMMKTIFRIAKRLGVEPKELLDL